MGPHFAVRRDLEVNALNTSIRSATEDDRRASPAPPVLDELTVRLHDEGGEALATAVRALPHTPWLTFLDAYVDDGQVVVVLPTTDRSLGDVLREGLHPDVAQVLLWSFDESMDLLFDQGLAPATLDPDSVGVTVGGNILLLPTTGPASAAVERDAVQLIARLEAADGTPDPHFGAAEATEWPAAQDASVAGRAGGSASPVPSGDAAAPVRGPLDPTPAYRRADVQPGGSSASSWGRTAVLAGVLAGAVLLAGVVLGDRQTATGREGASSVPADRPAATSELPAEDLDTLVADLAEDPALRQDEGRALVQQLEQIQATEGPRRAASAAATLETLVRTPLEDARTAARVRAVVRPIAQPADVAGLIALVEVDPTSHGPAGPVVLSRLKELQALPPSELARTKAQDLAAFVASRSRSRELTATFADIARTVLRPLAQPADLPALLRAVQVQPERFGPGTPALVARLDKLVGLQGDAARSEAAALLEAIDAQVAGGSVSKDFQDIAEPVLNPIATATATGGPT